MMHTGSTSQLPLWWSRNQIISSSKTPIIPAKWLDKMLMFPAKWLDADAVITEAFKRLLHVLTVNYSVREESMHLLSYIHGGKAKGRLSGVFAHIWQAQHCTVQGQKKGHVPGKKGHIQALVLAAIYCL